MTPRARTLIGTIICLVCTACVAGGMYYNAVALEYNGSSYAMRGVLYVIVILLLISFVSLCVYHVTKCNAMDRYRLQERALRDEMDAMTRYIHELELDAVVTHSVLRKTAAVSREINRSFSRLDSVIDRSLRRQTALSWALFAITAALIMTVVRLWRSRRGIGN